MEGSNITAEPRHEAGMYWTRPATSSSPPEAAFGPQDGGRPRVAYLLLFNTTRAGCHLPTGEVELCFW